MIKVWTPSRDEEKQKAQLYGMASVLLQTKCWDVDFLAHCGNRRTINSVMVFMLLGQEGCPILNLTASENMFTSQKATLAFFKKKKRLHISTSTGR